MKKLWVIPLIAILLAGCGKKQALETVTDTQYTPVVSMERRIQIQLPPELSTPTLESEDNCKLYLCDDYSITVQTMESGDLQKTIRNATGMNKADLQIVTTQQGAVKRHQWVWTTGGEQGAQVGRACVLDDGTYHYVLTAFAEESVAGRVQHQWKEIFTSFQLATEREEVSTGS